MSLRRLPRFMDVDKFVSQVGLDEDVHRSHSFLIVGASNGNVHWDEPENIIVGVSGLNVIFMVPGDWADGLSPKKCQEGEDWVDWLKADPFREEFVPFHMVVLKPGQGVVIPSKTLHAVYGTVDRLAFNAFMEPKWGHMQWTDRTYWKEESIERRALRHLWVGSMKRAWEEKGVGLYFQGGMMEML